MTTASAAAATAAPQPAPTGTQAARQQLSATYDNFLRLLTTQLQYQDPLQPMDSAQFTNQLVQYSQVEQQIAQNDKLNQLLALQNASQARASLGFIGLDVQTEVKEFEYTGSPMSFQYTMPKDVAPGAQIRILTADGRPVATATADTRAGTHEFVWNGRNREGENVRPGTFRIEVVASDLDKKSLSVSTTAFARVTGIETDKGETFLLIGKSRVPIDLVRSAREPGAAA